MRLFSKHRQAKRWAPPLRRVLRLEALRRDAVEAHEVPKEANEQ